MPWYSFRFPIHDKGCRPGGTKKPRVQIADTKKKGLCQKEWKFDFAPFPYQARWPMPYLAFETLPIDGRLFVSRAAWMEGRG